MIAARKTSAYPVMVIHHARDGVKPKPINLVLLDVPSQITQQKSDDLVLAVVEYHAVPGRVVAFLPRVRVAVIRAIEPVYSVVHVIGGVSVHYIYDDSDSDAVRPINQVLELVGGALPARRCVEARHVVAEGAVVGVLLYRHQLDAVVSTLLDMGKNGVSKVRVRVHFPNLGAHAYMALVNTERANFFLGPLVLELKGLGWTPKRSIVKVRVWVLNQVVGPSWVLVSLKFAIKHAQRANLLSRHRGIPPGSYTCEGA